MMLKQMLRNVVFEMASVAILLSFFAFGGTNDYVVLTILSVVIVFEALQIGVIVRKKFTTQKTIKYEALCLKNAELGKAQ